MKTNSLFVNPFLSGEEIQAFIERKNAIDLAKENNKKHTLFFFEKVFLLFVLSYLINF